MKTRRKTRRGFTLLEVLLVLAILGVIAAMVVPQLLGRQEKAMIDTTRLNVAGVQSALEMYAVDHSGQFPEGDQEAMVDSLVRNPQDQDGAEMAPYLDSPPEDAWGEPINYEWPNSKGGNSRKPAIWSAGPNRQNEDGAGDDINNWSRLEE